MRRWRFGLFVSAAATALAAAMAPGTAAASVPGDNAGAYGTTFIDGAGDIRDDFGDHQREVGSLCNGCSNSQGSDLVLVWQTILYSENLLGPGGIDGYFGPGTKAATQAWQRRFDLDDDGIVGPATWNAADNRLKWPTRDSLVLWYDAKGTSGHVAFIRGGEAHGEGAYDLFSVTDGPNEWTFYSDSHRLWFHTITNFYYD